MSGAPDPLYVRARTALLDAAEALADVIAASFTALVSDLLAATDRLGVNRH